MTQTHTVRTSRYLVVPHADVGPDVIVDYRLLFIFRLQTHKIKWGFFGGEGDEIRTNDLRCVII